jgi:hypothetical protein
MNEATLAIAASAGTILPHSASAGQKWGAVLGALGLLLLLYLVTAVVTRKFNPSLLVMGFDGRVSTSKFQWFLWIAAILFAYTALWVLRAEQGEFAALGVTSAGLLTVLGFSAATAIAAKGITTAYVHSGRVTKTAIADIGPEVRGGILQNDSGAPELAKIQLVGFTLITIGIFLTTVIHEIVTSPGLASLPNIGIFLVALIGISQAGYLGQEAGDRRRIGLARGRAAEPAADTILEPDRAGSRGPGRRGRGDRCCVRAAGSRADHVDRPLGWRPGLRLALQPDQLRGPGNG